MLFRSDVIPANIDLSAAEINLVGEVAREHILANALRKVAGSYDVILIDCQPSLGLLTVNALAASDRVLVPLSRFIQQRAGAPAVGKNLVAVARRAPA